MRKVTKCGNCGKIVQRLGSFKASILEPKTISGIVIPEQFEEKVISLCRPCTAEAGYKVKGISNGRKEN